MIREGIPKERSNYRLSDKGVDIFEVCISKKPKKKERRCFEVNQNNGALYK